MDLKTRISNFMTEEPATISEEASLHEAFELMKEKKIHHLPVVSDTDLVGILSDRDLRITELMPDASKITVGDLMTPNPYTAAHDLETKTVIGEMLKRKCGCAIILNAKCHVAGIFTQFDALKLLYEKL